MAGNINPEEAIGAIVTIFTNELGAALDVVDAAYADTITLEDIKDYYEQFSIEYDAYPAVVLVCDESVKPDPVRKYDIWHHAIKIYVLMVSRIEGNESLKPQEELTRRLARTMEAMVAVLEGTNGKHLTVSSVNKADYVFVNEVSRPVLDLEEEPEDFLANFSVMDIEVRIS